MSNPTRFPGGISFILPHSEARSGAFTFVAGDTTPSVADGSLFFAANSGVTVSKFDGGEKGKVIWVYDQFGLLTFATGGQIVLAPTPRTTTEGLAINTGATMQVDGSGATTTEVTASLTMASDQVVTFLFTDSARCVQINKPQ